MSSKELVALVTGASRGIGLATAKRFAREGMSVVCFDLDEAEIEEVAADIREAGGSAAAAPGSVTDRAQIEAAVQLATERFGRLDVLVNNAGIARDALSVRVKEGAVSLMSEAQWNEVLEVNLKGTFLCAQAAAQSMIERESGAIINTSSVGALGNIGQANYSASKAGVIGLTRTLALEYARYGIRVNAVAPGAVKTRLTAGIPPKILDTLISRIPLRRLGEPEEIASVSLFLASPESAYITGQVLWVDGGLSVGV